MLNYTDKTVYTKTIKDIEKQVRAVTTFDVRRVVTDATFWLIRDRALVFCGALVIVELEERHGGP